MAVRIVRSMRPALASRLNFTDRRFACWRVGLLCRRFLCRRLLRRRFLPRRSFSGRLLPGRGLSRRLIGLAGNRLDLANHVGRIFRRRVGLLRRGFLPRRGFSRRLLPWRGFCRRLLSGRGLCRWFLARRIFGHWRFLRGRLRLRPPSGCRRQYGNCRTCSEDRKALHRIHPPGLTGVADRPSVVPRCCLPIIIQFNRFRSTRQHRSRMMGTSVAGA